MSDPQFGMFTKNASFEQETVNLEFAIASANRLKPAFVVITGDMINNPASAAQAAQYNRIGCSASRGTTTWGTSRRRRCWRGIASGWASWAIVGGPVRFRCASSQ